MSELAQGLVGLFAPTPASQVLPPLIPASAGMLLAAAAVLLLIPPAVRLSAHRGRRADSQRTDNRRTGNGPHLDSAGDPQGPSGEALFRRLSRGRGSRKAEQGPGQGIGPGRGKAQKGPARNGPAQAVDAAGLLDLTGALLTSGVGIEAALDRLAACVPGAESLAHVHRSLTAGAGWEAAWSGVGDHPELRAFGEHLAFAHATGAPTAELLQTGARQARAERRQQAEQRAARLGVQMVIPLGLCFLPAFVLLGVVPVVLALVPEALGQMG